MIAEVAEEEQNIYNSVVYMLKLTTEGFLRKLIANKNIKFGLKKK